MSKWAFGQKNRYYRDVPVKGVDGSLNQYLYRYSIPVGLAGTYGNRVLWLVHYLVVDWVKAFKIDSTPNLYSVETADSFHKHVNEPMQNGKAEDETDRQAMTKEAARKVLSLPDTINGSPDDKAEVKRSYRKQSFKMASGSFRRN